MKKALRKLAVVLSLFLSLTAGAESRTEDDNVGIIGEEKISDEVKPSAEDEAAAVETGDVAVFGRIDPFENIVVLQKRFLPKKNRFETSLSLGFLADNPFFMTSVVYLRAAYSFSEAWAMELAYFKAVTSETGVTENLLEQGNVTSSISAVPEQFYGVDAKWTPIYGKLAFWNRSIIPIDNYYLAGIGQISITGDESPLTVHLATGLSFALKKWLALRLELGFYSYNTAQAGSFTDTHFNLGLSAFFPGAKYR